VVDSSSNLLLGAAQKNEQQAIDTEIKVEVAIKRISGKVLKYGILASELATGINISEPIAKPLKERAAINSLGTSGNHRKNEICGPM